MVQQSRQPGAQHTGGGQCDAGQVEHHGPGVILADDAHEVFSRADNGADAGRLFLQHNDIGGPDGQIGLGAPDGNAHIRYGQRRCVVDPVADHGRGALRPEFLYPRNLVFRSQPMAPSVRLDKTGHALCLGRFVVSGGQQHPLDAQIAEQFNAAFAAIG